MTLSRDDLATLALRAQGKGKAARAQLPLPKARKEVEVLRAILDYLATRGDVVAWRANVGAVTVANRHVRFGFKGCPDIVGYVRRGLGCTPTGYAPIFLAVECKAPGKLHTLTPAQRAFLDMVRKDGGIAIVADSVEAVRRGLEGR